MTDFKDFKPWFIFGAFIVFIVLIVLLIWFNSQSENFINGYHNEYCPTEDQVYVDPPDWWQPTKKYNPADWFVDTPDLEHQKEFWYH